MSDIVKVAAQIDVYDTCLHGRLQRRGTTDDIAGGIDRDESRCACAIPTHATAWRMIFLRSTGANIREGHGEAYYVSSVDFISMPAFQAFKGTEHFYNVAFHELTHWTGRKSRLDRDLKNRFGSRDYAAEELVAELGAAFLSAEFGFDGDVRNAGYIATWIELLKADKRAFFTACKHRRPGCDLRGLACTLTGALCHYCPWLTILWSKERIAIERARAAARAQDE